MCPQDHRALSEVIKLNPSMRVIIRHMMTTSTAPLMRYSTPFQSLTDVSEVRLARLCARQSNTKSGIAPRAEVGTREGRSRGRSTLASGAPSKFLEEVL